MTLSLISRFEPYARALMRIVAGFLFSLHGFQKVLGLLGGVRGTGAPAEFLSLAWVGGFLELAGGLLLMAGLFRRPVAFIVSGEMAVAYFMAHFPRGFWPVLNGGELAALYAFVFLYLFAAETDPWSLDRIFWKKRLQQNSS